MAKQKTAPRSIRRMFPQVKTVIDAKVPITIHVGKSDCSKAEPLNPQECAIAKAAKREYKVDAAVIGISTSYLIKGSKATRFHTPGSVQREIVSFDRHNDFEPGSYYLIPKSPSMRLDIKPRGRKDPKRSHSAKRVIHKAIRVRDFGHK